jgi:hypothetical protein
MHPVLPPRSRFQHNNNMMHGGSSSSENDAIVHSPISVTTTTTAQQYRNNSQMNHTSTTTPLFGNTNTTNAESSTNVTGTHTPLLFQNVYRRKRDAGHQHHPYPPPFHQRNNNHTDHFYSRVVQTAMKVILLSPVLVLVVWSIAAVTWTNQQLSVRRGSSGTVRQQQQNTLQLSTPATNRRSWMFGRRRTQQPPQQYLLQPQQGTGPIIVQPTFLQEQQPLVLPIQGSAEDYYQDPVPMVGLAAPVTQAIPLTSSTNVENNLVVPLPEMTSSSGKKQYYYSFPEQEQSQQRSITGASMDGADAGTLPNVVALNDPVTGKTRYYYTFPEQGGTSDLEEERQKKDNLVTMTEVGGTLQLPLVSDPTVTARTVEDSLLLLEPQPMQQETQPLMRSMSQQKGSQHSHFLRHGEDMHHSSKQSNGHVQYYFYDPKGTKKDQHGRLHLPQFVYDTYGRVVSLKSLTMAAAAATTPVLVQEPQLQPSLEMIHQNATTLNATVYNYTHSHPPVVETRQKRTMSVPKQFYAFSKNESQSSSSTDTDDDSSMIICTVGVMALFVGALSARRMRHQRSILSVCIENETLEDDAAYDTAYTTTTNPNAFGSHYNTFAQGWKGDLEKFDV